MTIVASTINNGSYTWEVPDTLAPASTGYGIQLIDSDGSFQYSPQCGVANSAFASSSSVSSGSYITMTLSTGANYTGPTAAATSFGNSSIVLPTASLTVPATLQSTVVVTPSATLYSAMPSAAAATTTAASVGGAVAMNAGVGFAGLAGLFAAIVL